MSAWMTNRETRSVIAKGVWYYSADHRIEKMLKEFHVVDGFEKYLDPEHKDFTHRFHYMLTKINALSLQERYDDDARKLVEEEHEYDETAPVVTMEVLYGLISCWIYQSCEGMANETDFFKLVENIQGRLAQMAMEKKDIKHWGLNEYTDLMMEERIPNASGRKYIAR